MTPAQEVKAEATVDLMIINHRDRVAGTEEATPTHLPTSAEAMVDPTTQAPGAKAVALEETMTTAPEARVEGMEDPTTTNLLGNLGSQDWKARPCRQVRAC